jgi:hypothetical protein
MCLELRTDHGSGEANKPQLPSLIMTWQLIHGNTETAIQDYISEQKYKRTIERYLGTYYIPTTTVAAVMGLNFRSYSI